MKTKFEEGSQRWGKHEKKDDTVFYKVGRDLPRGRTSG
jgi:hypothetical protein